MTHLLDLQLLAPDIQKDVLFLEAVDGKEPLGERVLWAIAHAGAWGATRALARGEGFILSREPEYSDSLV